MKFHENEAIDECDLHHKETWLLQFRGKTFPRKKTFHENIPLLYGYHTVKTLNIGTPRPATVVVINIKQFNFTRK